MPPGHACTGLTAAGLRRAAKGTPPKCPPRAVARPHGAAPLSSEKKAELALAPHGRPHTPCRARRCGPTICRARSSKSIQAEGRLVLAWGGGRDTGSDCSGTQVSLGKR